ncbi:hypothetical protein [Corallococcus carmarthensis]|uniref:Lipoprotein n=1 Tax=Corallococcus carmarthensis TaxID=2316728 RepID=A0A3A8JX05_9BACT|nr:hypothetical protein [Corallococcus carmarthensis]NOK18099.1 hypothetical protein [Corallococcus carmarthensis]RKG94891.1 hypothetical protein D7X32_40750 [Corallococcus carmarthensis]
MSRSIPALALVVGGLLFGCGGMPEEGETLEAQESQAAPEGNVTQSAVTTVTISGASISYNSTSDSFTVRDTLADGHSAVAVVYNHRTGSTGSCWNKNGAGTSAVCDRSYPNNPQLSISACTGEYSTGALIACSGWVPVNAFAPTK